MDYLTINSEREENDRVLQNLKDAMKQRNLAKMRDAEAELVERYGFYDALSDKVSLVPFKRRARVFEWERFVKEYKVLKTKLENKKQLRREAAARKRYMGRLIQREGESLLEYYLRLTKSIPDGGAGFKNLSQALRAVAAAKLESNKHAPPANPDEWKCPACNHMNPKTDKICEMCKEPKPKKFQMLKKSKRKSSRKTSRKRKASRKTSRKRRSAKRKTSRKRRSAKRKTSRKRRSSKRKASRKRSRKRRSSKRCPAGCVKKKTSKRKSRKVKKS